MSTKQQHGMDRRNFLKSAAGVAVSGATLATLGVSPVESAAALAAPQPGSYTFRLEVDGLTFEFNRCSGLGSEIEVVESKGTATDGSTTIQKMAGRRRWSRVTLLRGVTQDLWLWNWRQMVVVGNVAGARKNATISMLNSAAKPVARWTMTNVWPSKLAGPSFDADSNDVAVEGIELVCEGLERDV